MAVVPCQSLGSFSRFPIAAMPLYRSSAMWDFDRLRYVGSLSPQLVVFAIWDFDRLSWSLPVRGTLVLAALRGTLVAAFAMWDFGRLS